MIPKMKNHALGLLIFAAMAAAPGSVRAQESPVYLDPAKPIETRVADLLPRLTIDEKISMVHAKSTFAVAGVPRHSLPDDKGMYAAVIDPTNGYAYFFGNYLFKLDITGNLPVQVGTNALTGQFTEGAIDPAAGYAYMPRSGGTIYRFSLGTGTNSASNAGSFSLRRART